jgi:hypothetical protein
MKAWTRTLSVVAMTSLAFPCMTLAEGAVATTSAEGSLPHGDIGGPGWEKLPRKERVAREWRSLPRAERVAREKRGKKPEILRD